MKGDGRRHGSPALKEQPRGKVRAGAVLAVVMASAALVTCRVGSQRKETRTPQASHRATPSGKPCVAQSLKRIGVAAPAHAPVVPLPYLERAVPLPEPARWVDVIEGRGSRDVWMVVASASRTPNDDNHMPNTQRLVWSDGERSKIVAPTLCREEGELTLMLIDFRMARATAEGVSLYGVVTGTNQQFALRVDWDGSLLLCPDESSENELTMQARGTCVNFFESDGQSWLVERALGEPLGHVEALEGTWRSAEVVGAGCTENTCAGGSVEEIERDWVVTMGARGSHGWLVARSAEHAHLLEWTGERWRSRDEVLPKGILPTDLVALATLAGSTWALTAQHLLRWEGSRFVLLGVPEGFVGESLLAAGRDELWLFAPGRVYRYLGGLWQRRNVPLHPTVHWLAQNGDLWLAGPEASGHRLQTAHPTTPVESEEEEESSWRVLRLEQSLPAEPTRSRSSMPSR